MLDRSDLIEIPGWERDHYGDHICEWKRDLEPDEAKEDYDAFVLYVQEDGDIFNISITVTFTDGRVGDLLSAKYSDTSRTVEEAMEIGREFTERLKSEYNLR